VVEHAPPDAVHLAVVDPGVGTARRPLAIQAGPTRFVGPDNGLLSWAVLQLARSGRIAARVEGDQLVLGPGVRAVELTEERWWRAPLSRTFHARDLFGPVAAHLSAGVALDQLGRPLDRVRAIPFPEPQRRPDGSLAGEVVHVDRFGNLITSLPGRVVPEGATITVGGRRIHGLTPTFGAGQGLIAVIGSSGFVEVAVSSGSAADELGLGVGAPVVVAPGSAPASENL
jgi:S-adenosylmethionine hydrolase